MRAHSYSTHSPRFVADMRAWKYGSLYVRRAASTASRLDASRLKNQIPGLSSNVTYVRRFSSRNELTPGRGTSPRPRSPVSWKGVIPIQALPSWTSTSSSAGTCGRTASAGTRQCAKSSSSHVCPIVQPRAGTGQGRWPRCSSDRDWRNAASNWNMSRVSVALLAAKHLAATWLAALGLAAPQQIHVLVIEATWGPTPISASEIHTSVTDAEAFLQTASFGQVEVSATETG